ncbi:MAG: type II secretion system protein GspL, partial [Pseudomonadota bacterium]
MTVYLRLEAPYEWVKTDGKKVEAFGVVPDLASYPIAEEQSVVGVVSGEWVTTHQVTLPAKTRKQFNTALPFALEESFAEDIENLHFVCTNWKAGEAVNVLAVSHGKLSEWHQLVSDNKIPATKLLPDYALLPEHEVAQCSLARVEDKVLANQKNGGGVVLESDLLDLWLREIPLDTTIAVNDESFTKQLIETHSDRDFRHWPFGDRLAHWIDYHGVPDFDIWTDRLRPAGKSHPA